MKQLYFILIFLMSFMLTSQENIFFSEYAEGSSNNKYLEIYNNSDQTVDLTQYAFPNVSNDPTTVGEYEYWNTFDAGATIEPFGIYVIANPSADGAILAEADMTFTYLSNGDDGFKLVYGTEDSFTVVDELGDWQGDPGSGWDVAGVSGGTANHTLVRKSSVQNGSSWSVSAGTTAEDSEWIVYDQDTWTYLGSHEIESAESSCTFTINLSDSYGDGWYATATADHSIDVLVGGVVVLDDITIPGSTGGTSASYSFEVTTGALIDILFTDAGSWAGECGYVVLDNNQNEIISVAGGGTASTDPGPADTTSFEAVCQEGPFCPVPTITSWVMGLDSVSFDGTSDSNISSYTVEYSETTFVPGDGTATSSVTFESFPYTLTGLVPGTTYYFAMQSDCGEGLLSDFIPSNDAPAEWSTTGFVLGCGESISYDYPNGQSGGSTFDDNFDLTANDYSSDLLFSTTADDSDGNGSADAVTVTLGGTTESGWDWLFITDGAGNLLYGPASGTHSGSYTATDGTINVYLAADGSVQGGPVTFEVGCALSVSDNEISDLRIYPNPVDLDYVTIVSSLTGDKFVEMFDINGRRVLSTSISGNTLDISSLESGFYMTRVTIDGKSSNSKLIIE